MTRASVGVGWISDGVFATGTEVELTRAWSINAALPAHLEPEVADVDLRRLRQHRLQRAPKPDPRAFELREPGRGGVRRSSPWRRQPGRHQLQPRLQLLRSRHPHAVEPGAAARYRPRSALHQAEHRVQGTGELRGERLASGCVNSAVHSCSSRTRTSGRRCSAGSATSIHDRLSDPGSTSKPPAETAGDFRLGRRLFAAVSGTAIAADGADLSCRPGTMHEDITRERPRAPVQPTTACVLIGVRHQVRPGRRPRRRR